MSAEVVVAEGLREEERDAAAAILWTAFAGKLGTALGEPERGRRFLSETLDADLCLTAHDAATGELVGVAVLGAPDHTGPGGELRALWRIYGTSAAWRLPLLVAMEGSPSADALYVDAIAVSASARGRGVGTMLLDRAVDIARRTKRAGVELEVVDANPQARALYERLGYEAVGHQSVPWPLSRWLGIRGTTTMRLPLGSTGLPPVG